VIQYNGHDIEIPQLYTVRWTVLVTTGDEIIAINDASVAGLTNAEVLDLMQRHADAAQLRITARRHVMQRISRSAVSKHKRTAHAIHNV